MKTESCCTIIQCPDVVCSQRGHYGWGLSGAGMVVEEKVVGAGHK